MLCRRKGSKEIESKATVSEVWQGYIVCLGYVYAAIVDQGLESIEVIKDAQGYIAEEGPKANYVIVEGLSLKYMSPKFNGT